MVSATTPTTKAAHDPAVTTLGDVLYAKPGAENRVPETLWVGLLQSIAAGDQLALHALYGRVHRIVFTLVMRIVNDRQTAEELTIDVFHDVWRRAGSYDPSRVTVVAWIMNQARSRAIDRIRFEQRKKRTRPAIQEPDDRDVVDSTDETLVLSDQHRALRNALTTLTSVEREAIETTFFCEYSYADAARRLNEPLGTIKTRIRSGLAKLRRALTQGAADQ
jgi:RNA polymerase sigma-70 factor (ECF subfamily)